MSTEQATGHLADAICEIHLAMHDLPPDTEYDGAREECRRLQLHLSGLTRRIEGSGRYLKARTT